MRVLGVDYGSARCGCAVSDPTGVLVTPLEPVLAPGTRRGLAGREWRCLEASFRPFRYIRTSIAARSPSLTRLQQIEVTKIAAPGRAQTSGTT